MFILLKTQHCLIFSLNKLSTKERLIKQKSLIYNILLHAISSPFPKTGCMDFQYQKYFIRLHWSLLKTLWLRGKPNTHPLISAVTGRGAERKGWGGCLDVKESNQTVAMSQGGASEAHRLFCHNTQRFTAEVQGLHASYVWGSRKALYARGYLEIFNEWFCSTWLNSPPLSGSNYSMQVEGNSCFDNGKRIYMEMLGAWNLAPNE